MIVEIARIRPLPFYTPLRSPAGTLCGEGRGVDRAARAAMAPRERALVIFVGLMRAFERAFPAFRHTLITPNEQSFDFEIAVATSLTQTCSDKDRKSGCCRADASAYKYVNRTGDELLRRIRITYAPYLRHGQIGVDIFVTPAPRSHPGSQPQRLRPLLARPQYNLRHFGVVIVARPDAAVVRSNSPLDLFHLRPATLATEVTGRSKKCTIRPCTSHRSLLPRIDLRKECASRPGLSIVAGGHHGNGGAGLSRDSDYLYLACTPAALLRYFYAVAPGQTSCMCGGGGAACDRVDRNDTAEPLTSCATNIGGLPCDRLLPNCIDANKTRAALVPADFKALQMDPNKLSCRSVWCPTLAQFRRDGYRLGTVDRAGLWRGSSATSSTHRWATAAGRERARNRQSGWGTFTGFPSAASPSFATGVAGRSRGSPPRAKSPCWCRAASPGGLARRTARKARLAAIAGPARVRGSCRSFTRSQLRSERRLRRQSS